MEYTKHPRFYVFETADLRISTRLAKMCLKEMSLFKENKPLSTNVWIRGRKSYQFRIYEEICEHCKSRRTFWLLDT